MFTLNLHVFSCKEDNLIFKKLSRHNKCDRFHCKKNITQKYADIVALHVLIIIDTLIIISLKNTWHPCYVQINL